MTRLTYLIGHTSPLPPSLTDPNNYGMMDFRQPSANGQETILLQEPGRIINEFRGKKYSRSPLGVCYRDHCFALIDKSYQYIIRVENSVGTLDFRVSPYFPTILMPLESDARFILMHLIYNARYRQCGIALPKAHSDCD